MAQLTRSNAQLSDSDFQETEQNSSDSLFIPESTRYRAQSRGVKRKAESPASPTDGSKLLGSGNEDGDDEDPTGTHGYELASGHSHRNPRKRRPGRSIKKPPQYREQMSLDLDESSPLEEDPAEPDLKRRYRLLKESMERRGQRVKGLYQSSAPKGSTRIKQPPPLEMNLLRQTFLSYGVGVNDDLGPEILRCMTSNEMLPLIREWHDGGSQDVLLERSSPFDTGLVVWGWHADRIARHAYNHGSGEVPLIANCENDGIVLGRAAQTVVLMYRRCQLVRDIQWEHPTRKAYFGYLVCAIMLLTVLEDLRDEEESFFAVLLKSWLANPTLQKVRPRWEAKYNLKLTKMPGDVRRTSVRLHDVFNLIESCADEVVVDGKGASITASFTCQEDLVLLDVMSATSKPGEEACDEVMDVLPGRTLSECRDAFKRLVHVRNSGSDESGSVLVHQPDDQASGCGMGVAQPKRRLMGQRLPGYETSVQSPVEKQGGNNTVSAPQSDSDGGAIVDNSLEQNANVENAGRKREDLERESRMQAGVIDSLKVEVAEAFLKTCRDANAISALNSEKLALAEVTTGLRKQIGELEAEVKVHWGKDEVMGEMSERLAERDRELESQTTKVAALEQALAEAKKLSRWRP
ncbi:hypothetical protein LTR10_012866 [Elasticomyces elasticus]|nr:hypothetical protein LTR10_012866 [Elasticomyces elasticus]KAK4978712.1 hypothetical protein LTR42_001212 [Elasticomyces elasticus]